MQVGRENNGCRVETLAVLALALAEELLPPLVEHKHVRLIAHEDLKFLSLAVKNVAQHRIFVCGVLFKIGRGKLAHCVGSAAHQLVKVYAGNGDGEKSDSGKHRISAANIIGNDKCFITLAVGKRLERAACAVCGHENALGGFFFAVFLFKQRAENAEGDRRLCRCARL